MPLVYYKCFSTVVLMKKDCPSLGFLLNVKKGKGVRPLLFLKLSVLRDGCVDAKNLMPCVFREIPLPFTLILFRFVFSLFCINDFLRVWLA